MQVNTYTHTGRGRDWVGQSRVIRSDRRPISRWSVQVMRKRSRYGGEDRRGWTLWVSVGPVRFEVGSR